MNRLQKKSTDKDRWNTGEYVALWTTSEKMKLLNMVALSLVGWCAMTIWELLWFNGLCEDKQVTKLLWQMTTIFVI